ncbi:carbon storage regulator [Xylanimonas oleitrophica]|uniref:Translational regulator CsrA n=1 Tax=Xylanimonas oleitrophica TaxID=2607479 RepID=A0A2W5Y744_9MICO|nr:carbon storage regulator CsrA [Xylanimonas oleitrophica]PZR54144.1 carbon storage regulator [Xylanimonas oleitrophica]
MLVLSRRVGESLVIGGGITVTVVEVRGETIRLGIDAPRDVRVNRAEVVAAVEAENAAAAGADDVAADALRALAAGVRRPQDPSGDARGGDARHDGAGQEPSA